MMNDDRVKQILQSEEVPEKLQPENIKKLLDDTNAVKKRKQIKQSRVIKTVSAAAAIVLVFTTGVYFAKPALEKNNIVMSDTNTDSHNDSQKYDNESDIPAYIRPESIGSLSYAKSYDDVYELYIEPKKPTMLDRIQDQLGLKSKYDDLIVYEEYSDMETGVDSAADAVPESDDKFAWEEPQDNDTNAGDATAGGAGGDYSETYNQEEGVIEADIVKTNGKQIFFSTGARIICSEVEDGEFKNSETLYPFEDLEQIYAEHIDDMYLLEDRLVVIGTGYNYSDESGDYPDYTDPVTFVSLYDIETLSFCSYYIQDGYYIDVRMVTTSLYVITNRIMNVDYDDVDTEDYEEYIPSYNLDGARTLCSAEDILLPAEGEELYSSVEYTIISGLNLNCYDVVIDQRGLQVIGGGTSTVYCTENNLYTVTGYLQSEITRFQISGAELRPMAAGTIDGFVKDQFSLSEYDKHLRVATTTDEWASSIDSAVGYNNSVYVLDMNMEVVGSVSDFGEGETIRSVNFDGDMAYVVTFMQSDPLFAIDLSNPENPVILDEFKITGYSSYMQKWDDGLLLGFGAEADETGWETGVKMTMFDNSDPENLQALCSVVVVSDDQSVYYVSSDGIGDRKALYIDPERNIIGFPLEQYVFDNTSDEAHTVCSYEFYSFENGEFQPLGSMYKNYYDDNTATKSFKRAVYIDGYLYALSADMFISANAETFEQVDICEFDQSYYSELKEEYLYD